MRLFQMHYSPWSERARWALEHHHLSYERVEHVPVLGVPLMRAAARSLTGKLSAPLLVDGSEVVLGSLDIARHAERRGSGEPLFPPGQDEVISRWNQIGERIVEAARILVTHKVENDPEAQLEATPSFVPGPLKGAVASSTFVVTSLLARKYGFAGVSDSTARAQAREGLLKLRAALEATAARRPTSDSREHPPLSTPIVPHLVGERFSYADLLMAASLQFLRPVADLYMPIGPATRRSWTNADLADEFSDLVAWRDRIYAEHRK